MTETLTGHYVETIAAGETVRAFVPDPLPPKLSAENLESLAETVQTAEAALAQLKVAGHMIPSLDWFVYSFVRKEALLTSEIEGTQATLADVLAFEQTGQTGDSDLADVEEVTNYVNAANYAFSHLDSKSGLPLSVRLLNECHQKLMQGVRGATKQPGDLRTSQVWIGGTRPGNAAFVPPPANQVQDLLGALENYVHGDDELHPLLRTAAAHVQFETIHPYLDGNGRIGRLLIALLLRHWGILPGPLLYLSVYLKTNQNQYYAHLGAVRTEAAWVDWMKFFLEGVQSVANDASATAQAIHRQMSSDRAKLLSTPKITVTALQLFELLPTHPVVSMYTVTNLLSTTKPTATKAIELLESAGVLRQVGNRKRDRIYQYTAYLDLLR